jgi:hypothetical protein
VTSKRRYSGDPRRRRTPSRACRKSTRRHAVIRRFRCCPSWSWCSLRWTLRFVGSSIIWSGRWGSNPRPSTWEDQVREISLAQYEIADFGTRCHGACVGGYAGAVLARVRHPTDTADLPGAARPRRDCAPGRSGWQRGRLSAHQQRNSGGRQTNSRLTRITSWSGNGEFVSDLAMQVR